MADGRAWTREEAMAAFTLYCQLPFGRLHKGNPDIIALASGMERTPSAVALKLVNFAGLDPAIIASGRTGMRHASRQDRAIWDEFHADWNGRVSEGEQLLQAFTALPHGTANDAEETVPFAEGETREATVQIRLQQGFFRRSILSIYGRRCCMSGITDERLLVASHIIPWAQDRRNRLNPRNGLCLSALHDRAFDRFLITATPDGIIHVSETLTQTKQPSAIMQTSLLALEGQRIALPERFVPDPSFLSWHNEQFAQTSRR